MSRGRSIAVTLVCILAAVSAEAGGKVTGFLYFEDIDPGDDDMATFTTDLADASTGRNVGAIRIPLEID